MQHIVLILSVQELVTLLYSKLPHEMGNYCMSRSSNIYSNLIYKMGHCFLDRRYFWDIRDCFKFAFFIPHHSWQLSKLSK